MAGAWRSFKNSFSRPLFTIIFKPEMLKFHPYSVLTGQTMVGFVIYCVLIKYLCLKCLYISYIFVGKALCNVSTTSNHNPDQVLDELTRALVAKGIPCQQKGYILRGKIKDASGNPLFRI